GSTRKAPAIGGRYRDAIIAFFEAHDHGVGNKLHLRRALAFVKQRLMQVDTVDGDVGMLEARSKCFPRRNSREHTTREGVAHQQGRRAISLGHDCSGDADTIEYVKDIGTELDAVADRAKFGGAFEHARGPSAAS